MLIWAYGVTVHEIWSLIKRFGTSSSVYSSTNKWKSSRVLTSQGHSSFQPEKVWESNANNTRRGSGAAHRNEDKNREEKKCISKTLRRSNWSPKMTCAYLIVQWDRKYLLQGYRSTATHLEDSSKSIVTPRCLVYMLMTNGEHHCQSLEAIHNHPEWSRQFGNLKWAV